ncbi:hypothetical protein C1I95_24365, partial [Micromonospora craterilacus]
MLRSGEDSCGTAQLGRTGRGEQRQVVVRLGGPPHGEGPAELEETLLVRVGRGGEPAGVAGWGRD